MAFVWEQCKFGELVDKYEDLVETPTDGYMRLGIRSHAKGTFYSYVEKGKELETAKMFRVAANNFIVNITFGWEHAVAITDENDAGKLVSHRFPQYQFHKGMIPKFFKYLILDESFKHHLELSSPGGAGRNRVLKLNDMLNYQMRFPSEQEQKKVANYFDTLDTLITLHQRKRMLRKCFFSIDWEQRKLGEVADIVGGGTPSTNVSNYWDGNIDWYAPAEISDQIFLSSSQRKITEKGYNNSSAKMLPIGTVLFTSRAGIGKTAILSKKGCTNQGFQSIVPHKDELDSYFIFSRTDELKRYGEIVGAGSTFVEVSGKQMANIEMMMPKTISEQKVIGAYFAKLDHLITLHQCKSNFCKKNEVNAWEQRKFGSLLNEIREKTTIENEDTLLSCAIDGMYLNSELFSHFRGQSNIGYLKVKKNDLILSAQNLHLGNCNVNLRFEHGIISPAYKVYELVDCNPLFVQAWIKMDKTKDFFLKSSTEGASVCRKNILWEELYKQELVVPAIEEQTVIGTYFEQFDQLITLHQWECNINENTEGNDEKQRKPIKKLIISEGNLSLVDDMFLLHRMTFLVCNKYILLRLNVVKYKITIIIISNILYSIVSLLIIACYLIVINKQLIILIYVEISVVIIKGDDDYARIRS